MLVSVSQLSIHDKMNLIFEFEIRRNPNPAFFQSHSESFQISTRSPNMVDGKQITTVLRQHIPTLPLVKASEREMDSQPF